MRRTLFFRSLELSGPLSSHRSTNSFRRQLPEIYDPPDIYFKQALKSVSRLKFDSQITNRLLQQRKFCLLYLNNFMDSLTVPLTQIIASYRKCFSQLHPFEATVAELTIIAKTKQGHKNLKEIIKELKAFRAIISTTAKSFISKLKQSTTQLEARVTLAEAQISLASLYNFPATKLEIASDVLASLDSSFSPNLLPSAHPPASCLSELLSIHVALRRIPEIDLSIPTLVLVGAPNVGKSSLVRSVSSGTPEVANYPFTTRGLSVGHILTNDLRIQVMDSPGLLDRAAYERNEMERLTFASLAHLPTAVVFVLDPTDSAGDKSSVSAQLNIRRQLRERFSERPWIDVISKSDMALEDHALGLAIEEEVKVAIRVSSRTGEGMDQLKSEILRVAQGLSPGVAQPTSSELQ